MRSLLLLPILGSLAVATPFAAPQDLNLTAVEATPDQADQGPNPDDEQEANPYNPAAARAAAASAGPVVAKRGVDDPCAQQPDLYGPQISPDTDTAFTSYGPFNDLAQNAPTPSGYSIAYENLLSSNGGNGYMGLTTLTAYDTSKCAALCDSTAGCQGFNLYVERDPTVNPADACPNPPSGTNYKCTLWGLPLSSNTVNNDGQWRGPPDANGVTFHVVIAASNGYNKAAPPARLGGFNPPVPLAGAINAPLLADGTDTYMGFKYFNQAYDPSVCAASCTATTAYARKHPKNGKYRACNFFAAYVLSEDGQALGMYCAMYTQPWDPQYATNIEQYRNGHRFTTSSAYGFTLSPQDPGTV